MAVVPGVYVEEGRTPPPPLVFESLATPLLVGNAALGPAGSPQSISSVNDYTGTFGGSPPVTLLDHGVRQFFDNGGRQALVMRLEAAPNSPEFKASLLSAIADPTVVEALRDVGIISIPGLIDVATISALQAFSHSEGKFLVIDSAQGGDIPDVRQQAAALKNDASRNSALYFPWITYSGLILPPGPVVAGIMAKRDLEYGCWKSPAGTTATVVGATGLARPLSNNDQELLNPEGICCLRQDSTSYPVRVWGARTLAESAAEWRYIAVRRMALALRTSLERGLQWTVVEPNSGPLWVSLRHTVGIMLMDLFRQGAFQGQTAKDAFYIRCGLDETMTEADIIAGLAIIEVGFAPLKPAEFVVIRIFCKTAAA